MLADRDGLQPSNPGQVLVCNANMKIRVERSANFGFEKLADGSALRIGASEDLVRDPAATERMIIPTGFSPACTILGRVGGENGADFIVL